jgi:chromosomal replication initiator protein
MGARSVLVDEIGSDLESVWARVLSALQGNVQPTALESWLRPCRLAAVDHDHLRVAAPSEFVREWVSRHHLPALRSAARDVLGGDPHISIHVDPMESSERETRPVEVSASPAPPNDGEFDYRYTFAAFVVGRSNQLAQAACQTVAELPSRTYNPLFLHGGAGLGKTHLLRAVGHEIARRHPSLHFLYLSTERFTNELITAIRRDRMDEFRARYRTVDVLLIDDIQFIAGKDRTQGEFFHTFNDLYEMRKQIVLSSDAAPKAIPEIGDQLRSRFESGLVTDIEPPDFETRMAIVKKKAALENVHLPEEVTELIARRVRTNIREIEGSLTRLLAFRSLCGRELTVQLAQEVLGGIWGEEERFPTVDDIQVKTSEFFGVKLADIRGNNRTRAVAFPRQIAMYLARKLTHDSLGEVGRAFGGKDHTTVLHAVARIQALIQEDPAFKQTIDALVRSVTI